MNSAAAATREREITAADPLGPINGLLDLFEAQVRLLLDHGAEAALRARLARLLPAPQPEPDLFTGPSVAHQRPGCAGAKSAPEAPSKEPTALAAAGELGLTALLGNLKQLERLKMDSLAHKAVTSIKAAVDAELNALKEARSS